MFLCTAGHTLVPETSRLHSKAHVCTSALALVLIRARSHAKMYCCAYFCPSDFMLYYGVCVCIRGLTCVVLTLPLQNACLQSRFFGGITSASENLRRHWATHSCIEGGRETAYACIGDPRAAIQGTASDCRAQCQEPRTINRTLAFDCDLVG